MYTSVMLVAVLGPGAPPAMSQAPVRQVVYSAMPGQIIYIVPSSSPVGIVNSGIPAGTVYYSQPVYVSSAQAVTTAYSNPVVVSGGSVIRYGAPLYSAAPVSYAPMSMGAVCRT